MSDEKICFLDLEAINQEQILQIALVDKNENELLNKYCYVENVPIDHLRNMSLKDDNVFKDKNNIQERVLQEFANIVKDYDSIYHFDQNDKKILEKLLPSQNIDIIQKLKEFKITTGTKFTDPSKDCGLAELYNMFFSANYEIPEHNALGDAIKLCRLFNQDKTLKDVFNDKEFLRPIKYVKPSGKATKIKEGEITNNDYHFIFISQDKTSIKEYDKNGNECKLSININDANELVNNIDEVINNKIIVSYCGKNNDFINNQWKNIIGNHETFIVCYQVYLKKYSETNNINEK